MGHKRKGNKLKEFGVKHFLLEMKISFRRNYIPPSISVLVLMLLFPIFEVILYFITKNPLEVDEIIYMVIITLTPFIIGYKFQAKAISITDVIFTIIIWSYILLIGREYKVHEFSIWKLIVTVFMFFLVSFWMVFNFNNISEDKKKFEEKKKLFISGRLEKEEASIEFVDGMEVDPK